MKKYIVWKFILGTPWQLTKEYEIIDAKSAEEAEKYVEDPYAGWGILGSREWTNEDEESDEGITFDLW